MISIVVPVYNVEQYISECIESLIGQSYEALEIILVNNCSTDDSLKICQEYARTDSRIKIIDRKKNEGPGKAREIGFQYATGDWLCYVDSDDYIEKDAFQKITKYLKSQADIYTFGLTMRYEDKSGKQLFKEQLVPGKKYADTVEAIGKMLIYLERQRLLPYMHNKVYKMSFLKEHPVDFVKMNLMEDFFYNVQVFENATSVESVDYVFYNYRRPAKATLATVYRKDFFALSKKRYVTLMRFLNKMGVNTEENRQLVYNSFLKHLIACFSRDAGAKLPFAQKRKNAKMYLEDPVTTDVLAKYDSNSKKMKMIVRSFKSGNKMQAMLLGEIVYLFQNKFRFLYRKLIK